jgi:hypothetical protein
VPVSRRSVEPAVADRHEAERAPPRPSVSPRNPTASTHSTSTIGSSKSSSRRRNCAQTDSIFLIFSALSGRAEESADLRCRSCSAIVCRHRDLSLTRTPIADLQRRTRRAIPVERQLPAGLAHASPNDVARLTWLPKRMRRPAQRLARYPRRLPGASECQGSTDAAVVR